MKKFMLMLSMASVLTLGAWGCGAKENTENAVDSDADAGESPDPKGGQNDKAGTEGGDKK